MGRPNLPILAEDFIETVSTLDVAASNGATYKFAGAELTIDGAKYDTRIIRPISIVQSINQSADRLEIQLSNIDRAISRLTGAGVKFETATAGRAVRSMRTGGAWQWQQLLTGTIAGVSSARDVATLTLLSDVYSAGLVGAVDLVQRSCIWKYKGEDCGYTGPEPTCDLIFESAGGCAGRNNQFRYGGVVYDTSKDSLTYPPPDTGGNNTGAGDGGGIEINYPWKNWDYQLSY